MSRHYLIDGYNIIKQLASLADLPLEEGRRQLVLWLNNSRPQGSANNVVTVVFDGNPEFWGGMPGGCVQVIFADGSADDKIKHIVEVDADKKKYMVVSNDKGITLYVRALGAQVLSVAEFSGLAVKGARKPKARPGGAAGKHIPLSRQEEINKELSKLWLKEQHD